MGEKAPIAFSPKWGSRRVSCSWWAMPCYASVLSMHPFHPRPIEKESESKCADLEAQFVAAIMGLC